LTHKSLFGIQRLPVIRLVKFLADMAYKPCKTRSEISHDPLLKEYSDHKPRLLKKRYNHLYSHFFLASSDISFFNSNSLTGSGISNSRSNLISLGISSNNVSEDSIPIASYISFLSSSVIGK